MQRLFFVRHGKTELNQGNYVQGAGIDSPLLEESRSAATKTGQYLDTQALKHVIVSPQQRAVQTADLITREFSTSFTVDYVDGFKEMDYGDWEGLHIPEIEKQHPTLFHHLRKRPELYDPSDIHAESYEALTKRGEKTIHDALAAYPDEDILFVGHSILIMCTVLSMIGKEVKDYRSVTPLDNTSITVLSFDGSSFSLEDWNGTDHLLVR